MINKLLLYCFIILYTIAGIMHFLQPAIYMEVIPDWLGNKSFINYTAGVLELVVAGLAFFKLTRKIASYLTIAMLTAFIISHAYFLQLGSCAGSFCIPAWIGWVRLIVIHPLLIWWAWNIKDL